MSRRPLAAILASLLLGGLIAVTTSVRAEERPAPTRGAVLALLTEHVETEQGKLRTRFWWKSAAGPAWTETDRALQRHLRRRGLRTSAPDDETRISRIYRHPNLSVDNATALASVLRERRVLVGEVTYRRPEEMHVGHLTAVRARVSVRLVTGAVSEPEVAAKWTFERLGYARRRAKAVEAARDRATEELATLVGEALRSAGGPVGIDTAELLIGFRRPGHGRVLEIVRRALRKRSSVDAVRVRWASEGLVAMEINPRSRDADRVVRRQAAFLDGQTLSGARFRRREGDGGGLEGVLMFGVERTDSFGRTRTSGSRGEPDG